MSRPRLPRPNEHRPFVLGHRGARAKAPENTMRAFEAALADGADGVEIDVRMTSDGALCIAHDEAVMFAGNQVPLKLGRLTSGQLEHLRLPSGESVPSLSNVLRFQAESGCLVNVELKADVSHPRWLCERAAAEIRAHGGNGLVLSSFSPVMVKMLARLLPHVPCALLFETRQIWTRRILPLRLLGASGVHPEESSIDRDFVRRVHTQGMFVGAWTINDGVRARELAEMGVDILIGDNPGALLNALRSGDAPPSSARPSHAPTH